MSAANSSHRSRSPPLRSACYLFVLLAACALTARNFSLAPTEHELPKPGDVASRPGAPATSTELLEVKDSYILYPATTAACGDAVILSFRAASSIHAARICLANPNCTFFSVSNEGDTRLCSGRVSELIPAVGWSSGDRKGCEGFGVEDSRSFASAAELPSCHDSSSAMHSRSCAYRNVATQKCLSDLIWLDRLTGVATQLQEHHLCLNAANKLEVSRELLSTEQCAWRAHESSSNHVLTHIASNSRLVPDILTHDLYTTSLKDRRTCLCGDVTNGLSVRHSCDSPGCRWEVGHQGCLYQIVGQASCFEDAIKTYLSHASSYVCFHPETGVSLVRSPAGFPSQATCLSHDNFTNSVPSLLASACQYDDASLNLVASGVQRCLCHNYVAGLVVGPYCGNNDCKWLAGSEVTRQATAHASFDVYVSTMHSCGMQLGPSTTLATLEDALQRCEGMAGCTFTMYHVTSGTTYFCNGYYNDSSLYHSLNEFWYSCIKRSCNVHMNLQDQQKQRNPVSSSAEIMCTSAHSDHCSCPSSLQQVISCSTLTMVSCDQCAFGYCPSLPGDFVATDFQHALSNKDTFSELPSTFDYVSLFQYDGRVGSLVTYNHVITDNVEIQMFRCYFFKGGSAVDPSSCEHLLLVFEVPLSLQGEVSTRSNIDFDIQFVQSVEYNKLLHVFVSATFSHMEVPHHQRSKPLVVMAVMNEGLTHFVSTKYLHHHSQALEVAASNTWSPLVHGEKLLMVVQPIPLRMVGVNTVTGECTVLYSGPKNYFQATLAKHGISTRSTTAYHMLNSTHWLGLLQHRKMYAYGPIVTHRVILLSLNDDNAPCPTSYQLSSPFRLPSNATDGMADIQVVDSVVIQASNALVSYRLGQHHSIFPLPINFANLELPPLSSYSPSSHHVRFIGNPDGVNMASYVMEAILTRWRLSNAPWNLSVEVVGPHLAVPPIADFAKSSLISSNTANNNPSRLVISFDEHSQVTRKRKNQYWVHCICGDAIHYDELAPNLRGANEVWVFHTNPNLQRLQKSLVNTKIVHVPHPMIACDHRPNQKWRPFHKTNKTFFVRWSLHAAPSIVRLARVFVNTFAQASKFSGVILRICVPPITREMQLSVDMLQLLHLQNSNDHLQFSRCREAYNTWTKDMVDVDVYIHIPHRIADDPFLLHALACMQVTSIVPFTAIYRGLEARNIVWYEGNSTSITKFDNDKAIHKAFMQAHFMTSQSKRSRTHIQNGAYTAFDMLSKLMS